MSYTVRSLISDLEEYVRKNPDRGNYQVILHNGHCCGEGGHNQRLPMERLKTISYSHDEHGTIKELEPDETKGDSVIFGLKLEAKEE